MLYLDYGWMVRIEDLYAIKKNAWAFCDLKWSLLASKEKATLFPARDHESQSAIEAIPCIALAIFDLFPFSSQLTTAVYSILFFASTVRGLLLPSAVTPSMEFTPVFLIRFELPCF